MSNHTMAKEDSKISARVELTAYANKVLAVLKAKYGLQDKSEAINKFAELYGEEVVEKEANDEYVKHILEVTNKHLERNKGRKMNFKELDALCEI